MSTAGSWESSFRGGRSISSAHLGSEPAAACPGQRSRRSLLDGVTQSSLKNMTSNYPSPPNDFVYTLADVWYKT